MDSAVRQKFCSRRPGNSVACRAESLRLLLHYLREHPCVDCGERDPVLLDFDHRDFGLEHLDVSTLVWRNTWPSVKAEIARCDVRCADCHRHRTAVSSSLCELTLTASDLAS